MDLSNLKPAKGATHRRKRVARGHGCHGKTGGRGSNGQKSRSGGNKGPGFEGGQTPWYRRLPKFRGFKSLNRKEYTLIKLSDLEAFEVGSTVTPESMLASGLVRKADHPVKVVGGGALTKKLTVQAHKFTAPALAAIEASGGKAEVI